MLYFGGSLHIDCHLHSGAEAVSVLFKTKSAEPSTVFGPKNGEWSLRSSSLADCN